MSALCRTLLVAALAVTLAREGFAQGEEPAAHSLPPAAVRPATVSSADGGTPDARAYFTDTELLDQNGRRLQFYSEVLKDRVVMLNVVYTRCKDACPLITRKLKEVRAALGEDGVRRVHFISISSDPQNDTPQALKAFAAKNEVDGANWIFLTGDKAKVDFVLSRLGQLGARAEEHSTLLIAGDVANKRWTKIRPDAPPPAIAERLKLLAEPASRVSPGR